MSITAPSLIDATLPVVLSARLLGPVDTGTFSSTWSCSGGINLNSPSVLSSGSPQNSFAIQLNANVLTPGSLYNCSFSVHVGARSAFSSVLLAPAPLPSGGSLIVPSYGYELTLFNLTTLGWHATSATLCYRFSFSLNATELPVNGGLCSTSPTQMTMLPQGLPALGYNITVIVHAVDMSSGVQSLPVSAITRCIPRAQALSATQTLSIVSQALQGSTSAQTVGILQSGAVALNALSNSSSSIQQVRSQLVDALINTFNATATTTTTSLNSQAAVLQLLLAKPNQVSSSTGVSALNFMVTLMNVSSTTSALSADGQVAIANSVSSVIDILSSPATSPNVTASTSDRVIKLVDMLGASQLQSLSPGQPAATIDTPNFRTAAWKVDLATNALSQTCHGTCVHLPNTLPLFTDQLAVVGIQQAVWATNPRIVPVPRPSSKVTSVNVATTSSDGVVTPATIANLTDPILITIQLDDGRASNGTVACNSFNTARNVWTSSGCTVNRTTPSAVTCACTHLTDFAIVTAAPAPAPAPAPPTPAPLAGIMSAVESTAVSDVLHPIIITAFACVVVMAAVNIAGLPAGITKRPARMPLYVINALSAFLCAIRILQTAFVIVGVSSALADVVAEILGVLIAFVMFTIKFLAVIAACHMSPTLTQDALRLTRRIRQVVVAIDAALGIVTVAALLYWFLSPVLPREWAAWSSFALSKSVLFTSGVTMLACGVFLALAGRLLAVFAFTRLTGLTGSQASNAKVAQVMFTYATASSALLVGKDIVLVVCTVFDVPLATTPVYLIVVALDVVLAGLACSFAAKLIQIGHAAAEPAKQQADKRQSFGIPEREISKPAAAPKDDRATKKLHDERYKLMTMFGLPAPTSPMPAIVVQPVAPAAVQQDPLDGLPASFLDAAASETILASVWEYVTSFVRLPKPTRVLPQYVEGTRRRCPMVRNGLQGAATKLRPDRDQHDQQRFGGARAARIQRLRRAGCPSPIRTHRFG